MANRQIWLSDQERDTLRAALRTWVYHMGSDGNDANGRSFAHTRVRISELLRRLDELPEPPEERAAPAPKDPNG